MSTEIAWIDVPGGRLHTVVDGSGPPVVLVHAGIVDLRSWDPLVPYLVEAGYRVIRYDTRGFGASTTADIDYSNRADLRAILDHYLIERAVLVGNSRCAMISLDVIIESPERVAAFVWVGGGIGGYDAEPTAEELALFTRMEAAEEALDGETVAELDVQVWVDGVGESADRVPAEIREVVRAMDRPLYEHDRVMGRPIPAATVANDHLGTIDIPVLAVVGALDTSTTRSAAKRLAATVEGARLVVLPHVAHLIGMEAPERLAALIEEFLAPREPWG